MDEERAWIRWHYVCATCWSPLTTINGKPICMRYPVDHEWAGYHLIDTAAKARARSERDYQEVFGLYYDTPWAYDLGLRKKLTPIELESGRRALRSSDSLL